MRDKKTIYAAKEKISEAALKEKFNSTLVPAGTLIMSFKLTVGRTSLLGVDAVHNEAIISVLPYLPINNTIRNYLFVTLGLLVEYVEQTDAIKGSTLNSTKIRDMFVPLSPLAEQERIVAEIEKYEPLIAEYDKLEQEKSKLDCEIYDKLKKSILQYAIQGKLVPQEPTDEPASVLLEKIRAEKKAKLGKKYVESLIYKGDDNCYYEHIDGVAEDKLVEVPFDLPDGWAWCKLKNFTNVVSARRVLQSEWKQTGIPFYRAREIVKLANYGNVRNELFISEEHYNRLKASGVPQAGDLMVTAVGTIGQSYVVQEGEIFYYKDASVLCFENRNGINAYWLKKLMDSCFMEAQILENTFGTTVKTITIEKAQEYLIPLPPLAEQQRIVDKINEIFANL